MELTIRDVASADVPAITAIYAAEVRDHVNTYEYDVPDEAGMSRRVRGVLDAGYPYLAAEHEGRLVGYAYANSYRARIGYRFTVENSVYVVAGQQGHGIGAALLERLIAECERRGYRQMVAVIGEPNNTASIRLHEKFGFRLVGVFRGIAWKHGRWLDTVQMQRTLSAGNADAPHDE
ncbi:N-acetyltransferase family protein [Pseudoxanthomonas putridarboris]|uniref:N-acetyltransferase family protein n=1 Tax=Pseudoxanthomonas putridarboris TaxID=752605 RepID=A0ABU9IZD2_9GAMM